MPVSLDAIPSPRELLAKHGLSPRKSWGQNFLHDRGIHAHIVRASKAAPGARVLEIGAGLGTLTAHLLATGAFVHAIERDRDLCTVLRAELGHLERFELFEADAVRFDYAQIEREHGQRPTIVGNLPYQLTGPLLFALLERHTATDTWVVMVQREVADRIASPPGSRRYGGISAALGRLRAITKVCDAPPGCFLPPPRVDSAVIALTPLPTPRGEVGDPKGYLALVRAAFSQRRKTLLNSLSTLAPKDQVRAWCEVAGVDPKLRAEALGPEAFAALQRARESEDA